MRALRIHMRASFVAINFPIFLMKSAWVKTLGLTWCLPIAVVRKLCDWKGCTSHEGCGGRRSLVFRGSGIHLILFARYAVDILQWNLHMLMVLNIISSTLSLVWSFSLPNDTLNRLYAVVFGISWQVRAEVCGSRPLRYPWHFSVIGPCLVLTSYFP